MLKSIKRRRKSFTGRVLAFVMAFCMVFSMVFTTDVLGTTMQVQAEETKTYLAVGESKTWDFKASDFGAYTDADGEYTTDDKILTITGTGSHNGSHGFTTKTVKFSLNVSAGTTTVSLGCCEYNNAQTAELQLNGETVVAGQAMNGKACGDALTFAYTSTEAVTLDVVISGNTGQIYIPYLTVKTEEASANATLAGSVATVLAGEKLVFTSATGTTTSATIAADGTYTVELAVGTTYTVTFEKGIYQVATGGSVDLSGTVAGATATNDITYTELSNRLVLDAEATVWDMTDSSFAGYGHTEWYSGDGLVISGTLNKHQDGSHGASTSTGNTFYINVPAGKTTITLGGCKYDDKTVVSLTDGTNTYDGISLDGKTDGIDIEKTVSFTETEDATITITVTSGGGYLHFIKAKTETVQPTVTVSGTVDAALNGEKLIFSDGVGSTIATITDSSYTVELEIGASYTVAFEKGLYVLTSESTIDLTNAAAGSNKTLDITYTELENRLVVDAATTIWNFMNKSFGAYGKSEWYSGDGLVINGAFGLGGDGSHGAATSTSNTFYINVPAGLTTITFNGCRYDNATKFELTCGDETKELSMVRDDANTDPVRSVTFTTEDDATIVIATTAGGGYLHSISAKTETVYPTATVSGTVGSAANGEVLNFMKDGATVATATIADGAYSVELSVGSAYTITFANAAVYEITGGSEVDLTETAVGATVTNNITYTAWNATKEFTVTLGDTLFTVTPGASMSDNFTVVASNGTGSVELVTPNTAIVWTNLEGLGGGILSADMVTGASDNITTSFSGNTLTVTYKDQTTNPASFEMLVKDNSATGEAVADGTPLNYNFVDGSIVSKLYDGSKYVINNGKTVKSADGLVTLTGNKKIYYNGSHGIVINQNDTISVNVAGDATITMVTCLYTNSQKTSEMTATAGTGTITPASQNFTSVTTDGETITFEYEGDATTLVFTYASSGSAYLHSMSVKNHVGSSDVADEQTVMPEIMTYGTPGSLEAVPVGQRFIFTQTGGQMNTDTVNGKVNSSVSYFGFPATTGKYKLEADVVLSSCGASNYNGIYFGAFDGKNIATVAIRNTTGLRGILSKSSLDMAGASTIDAVIESGQKVHYTVEKTDACFVITVTPEDGKTYTMEFDYKDSGVLLFKEAGVDTAISYGFIMANSSAIITNMKYYDENGTVLYDQNACYEPVGTAPIVASVSATAAYSREYISVNWTNSVAVVGDGRYVVQVSKDGSDYTTIFETTDTAVDYPITEAGEYIFRVAGKLGENGEVNTWAYTSALDVVAALTKPVVTISSTATSVSLSWDAVDNATGYEVYRYSFDEGEANAIKLATLSTTNYTDSNVTAEMPYYYYVTAHSADNYSNPSVAVWAVPSAGHTGDYVYEDEATEIYITKKSYDTVFDGKAVLEGVVMGSGTMKVTVNGTAISEKTLNPNDTFSLELTLAEGRNDVNLLFTDGDGKVTRKTYNFVYLTNYDIVVDAAYTGTEGAEVNGIPTYSTVQGAVDSINSSEGVVILVMAGSYEERLVVNAPNVSIIGEDREATLVHCYPGDLGSDYEAGEDMTMRCATYIQSGATGFSAENISFANDYVYATADGKSNKSADAIRVEADQSVFVNVKFSGVQDTLYMHSGKQYYYKCVIEGLVDFIYSGDDARSFFNDCEIVFVYESTKKGGYVCAPRTAEDATYGLTFYNCVITAEEGCAGNGYLLARPWGPNAYITWIDCYMGSVVYKYYPYNDMSGNSYKEARFYEFGSYGPGYEINSERRQISPAKAAEMVTDSFLGWSPASVSAAVAAKYVGDVTTDKDSGVVEEEYAGSDKYLWTDGDDTGLKMYGQEGYASSYGVTGGGLLMESSENYHKVATAKEFLEALMAVKESGKSSVIELTADINLGCNEIENFADYSAIIKPYGAQPLMHPALIESGVSVLAIEEMYNFTIFSKNGSSIKHANITMKNSGNIIIRNIKFDELWEWDEETSGNYDRNDWDYMTIDSACDGIWIDHCTFYKAYDGIVDMKNAGVEMNVTVSWCEFLPGSEGDVFFNAMMNELKNNAEDYSYYSYLLEEGMTEEQIYMYAYGQKKTHLLGQSDTATNAAGIRATFANNYYYNAMDRMPRVRYGVAHAYNCFMDAQEMLDVRLAIANEQIAMKVVSNGATSTCGAQVLLENCFINGIQDALNSGNSDSPAGYINAVNSLYYIDGIKTVLAPKSKSTVDTTVLITDADAFTAALPYDYVLYDASELNGIVKYYAGAGKLNLTTLQWEKTSYNAEWQDPELKEDPIVGDDLNGGEGEIDPDSTAQPTVEPTTEPTAAPTTEPEEEPAPTEAPTQAPAPTEAPVSPEEDADLSWDEIRDITSDKVEEMEKQEPGQGTEEKESVNINFTRVGKAKLPVSILHTIKGKNMTVAIQSGDGIALSITGKDLKNTDLGKFSSVDMTIDTNKKAIPEAVVAQKPAIMNRQVSIGGTEKFEIHVNLHTSLGTENAGKFANLYRYNPEKGVLEFCSNFRITRTGQAMFAMPAGGDYLITVTNGIVKESIIYTGGYAGGDYIVQPGDNLTKISRRFNTTIQKLLRNNPGLSNPDMIKPGDVLNVD